MASESTAELRTYGNWRTPRSAGLFGLGLLGMVLLFSGIMIGIIVMLFAGLLWAMVVMVVAAAAAGVVSLPSASGLTAGQRLITRVGWLHRVRSGDRSYRSGPLGRTPWGTHQLPGISARTKLFETTDSYNRPMAIVYMPTTNHYAVVISCQPDGAALVDQDQLDSWVAEWGAYLAMLGSEGAVAAAITIETAPDTGGRLRREVGSNLSGAAHPLAREVMEQVVSTYPSAAPTFHATLTITFKGTSAGGRRRERQAVIGDLRTKMVGLCRSVAGTGGGTAIPMSADQLCRMVRVAYDPAVADVLADADAAGQQVELDWSDVGPAAHEADWDCYRHDSAVSVTYEMAAPPRGLSYSTVLHDLLTAHAAISRKRVSLLYRPLPPAVGAALVEADKRNAEFRIRSTATPTARQKVDVAAAAAASTEEALGAGLVNFGLLATATVFDPAGLPDVRAAMVALGASARITLRPVYGSQDSAFAANLPLGLVTASHLKVPAILRSLT